MAIDGTGSYRPRPEVAEIEARYMPAEIRKAGLTQLTTAMRHMQRELIAAHFGGMDPATQYRASHTTAYLDAQIEGRDPGAWNGR